MPKRAAQQGRWPSRVLSLLLITAGTGLIAAWMALPLRRPPADRMRLVQLVTAALADPSLRAPAAEEIAAFEEPELTEVVEALARGAFRGGRAVGPEERALLEEALGSIEPRTLVAFLARTTPSGDAGVRREGLRLVAAHGGPEGVDALLDIASGRSPEDLCESAEDFEQSLGALIARSPEALEYLPGAWRRSSDAAFAVMVRAAGGCGRASALEVLADTLGRVPDSDGLVLAEIGRLGDGADPRSARAAARRVEDYLDSQQENLIKAAVNALGRLGARESVPDLVELLAEEDDGLARTAHSALRRLTGLRFRGEPEPWRAWLASEESWEDERLPALLSDLHDADPAVVRAALREVETHVLDRHALADDVVPLLGRDEPELRLAACDALRRLGSREPLADLIGALGDDLPVAEAARAALVALTGLDLPAEPPAWEAALAARR